METRNSGEEPQQIVDVRSVVEAVTAEDGDVPMYQVESLCMRCGENVFLFPMLVFVCLIILFLSDTENYKS